MIWISYVRARAVPKFETGTSLRKHARPLRDAPLASERAAIAIPTGQLSRFARMTVCTA